MRLCVRNQKIRARDESVMRNLLSRILIHVVAFIQVAISVKLILLNTLL